MLRDHFESYAVPLKRYGKDVHAIYYPNSDRAATEFVLKAFLDLYFEERGFAPLKSHLDNYETIRAEYFQCLMPDITTDEAAALLSERSFVVLEGPPGTGKTRMALELLQDHYHGRGQSIQFHPNTTYENFIGGLAPSATASDVGFRFVPVMGELMKAAAAAEKIKPNPYLLHIDEINRADLSKVLGEAVFLLEYMEEKPRAITLSLRFWPTFFQHAHAATKSPYSRNDE